MALRPFQEAIERLLNTTSRFMTSKRVSLRRVWIWRESLWSQSLWSSMAAGDSSRSADVAAAYAQASEGGAGGGGGKGEWEEGATELGLGGLVEELSEVWGLVGEGCRQATEAVSLMVDPRSLQQLLSSLQQLLASTANYVTSASSVAVHVTAKVLSPQPATPQSRNPTIRTPNPI